MSRKHWKKLSDENLHSLHACHRHQLLELVKDTTWGLEPMQNVKRPLREYVRNNELLHFEREGSSSGDQAGALSHTTAAGRKVEHAERKAANVNAPVLLCR